MCASKTSVLCIIDTIGNGGGAEQLLATLLPAIELRGYHVEIVALFRETPSLDHIFAQAGIKVHHLDISRRSAFIEAYRKLGAFRRAHSFDIYWGHLYYGNLAAAVLSAFNPRGRSIITLHSEGYSQNTTSSWRQRILIWLEWALLRIVNIKVAVSGAVSRDYERYFGWTGIEVAYNGVVTEAVLPLISPEARSATRYKFGRTNSDFLIVTPARYVLKKGHRYLFEAIQLLKTRDDVRVQLICCGHGPMQTQLSDIAQTLGVSDQITVSGGLTHTELFGLIRAADAVVIPSLREPFGIAAAEAMALEAPCILTSVDGFCELVGDNNSAALMVPPADGVALADAIVRFIRDPVLKNDIAKAGRQRVLDNFGIAVCAQRWDELFRKLLPRKSKAPS